MSGTRGPEQLYRSAVSAPRDAKRRHRRTGNEGIQLSPVRRSQTLADQHRPMSIFSIGPPRVGLKYDHHLLYQSVYIAVHQHVKRISVPPGKLHRSGSFQGLNAK